jgi:hypothetical protein
LIGKTWLFSKVVLGYKMDQEVKNELYDLNLIISTINNYKELLKDGRNEDEKQKVARMLIEKSANDWRKLYGEW